MQITGIKINPHFLLNILMNVKSKYLDQNVNAVYVNVNVISPPCLGASITYAMEEYVVCCEIRIEPSNRIYGILIDRWYPIIFINTFSSVDVEEHLLLQGFMVHCSLSASLQRNRIFWMCDNFILCYQNFSQRNAEEVQKEKREPSALLRGKRYMKALMSERKYGNSYSLKFDFQLYYWIFQNKYNNQWN